jgi:P-type conjugative transfer ATPase TrbB
MPALPMPALPLSGRDEHARRLTDTLRRQLGTLACDVLAQPGVFEIMLNPDGQLWEDRHGSGMAPIGRMSAHAAESFIGTVASMLRDTVTRESPIVECVLPAEAPFYGARFEGMLPPVVPAPTFSIRLKASVVYTLGQYVSQGVMTEPQRATIQQAVCERENILVVGATGTGKTTLTNAIIAHMADVARDHRLVIIEDTAELQCTAPNAVFLCATGDVPLRRLLKATMRLRPDRIIVGEVRDGTALDMLKAWNTGHPGGVCTVHANSARAGLVRIEQLIAEVSVTPMHALIAEAIDLIVSIAHTNEGRRIKEIVRVGGYKSGNYQFIDHGET